MPWRILAVALLAGALAGCDAGAGAPPDAQAATTEARAASSSTAFATPLQAMAGLKRFVAERAASSRDTATIATARHVRFEVLSEIRGGPWASIAEFDLLDENGTALPRALWKASADSTGLSEVASHAIDGDVNSIWHSRWEGVVAPMPHALTIDLGQTRSFTGFRLLPRQDGSRNGTVARYRLYVSDDGRDWGAPVEQGTLANPADQIGERTVVFGRRLANRAPTVAALDARITLQDTAVSFRIAASDPDGDSLAYSATGLPPGISIDAQTGRVSGRSSAVGRHAAVLQVEDARGAVTEVPLLWSIVEPPPPPEDAVRFVRLEALSEIHGEAWASVAEFNLLDDNGSRIPRDGWKASADSEAANTPASSAIDGSEDTLWHSNWEADAPKHPHALTIDLGRRVVVNGFRYLGRQDGTNNGCIAQYRFYTSNDGVHWGAPVATGDFTSLGDPNVEKTVYLK